MPAGWFEVLRELPGPVSEVRLPLREEHAPEGNGFGTGFIRTALYAGSSRAYSGCGGRALQRRHLAERDVRVRHHQRGSLLPRSEDRADQRGLHAPREHLRRLHQLAGLCCPSFAGRRLHIDTNVTGTIGGSSPYTGHVTIRGHMSGQAGSGSLEKTLAYSANGVGYTCGSGLQTWTVTRIG